MKANAVFEGGGVKAFGLIGAIKSAEQYGIAFEGVAGTSSGAIVASFIAAGYTADEMQKMMLETPFQSFLKKTWMHRLHFLGTSIRLFIKKGLYSGDTLECWVRKKLAAKGVRTFADLPEKKLRIIASDISQGKLLVLPNDIEQYGIAPGGLEVARAIRMSTSIPYFFDPVILYRLQPQRGPVYIVDGGLLSNFPLWIFDKAYSASGNQKIIPTIGFQLVGKNMNTPHRIMGPLTMFQALFATMMEAHDERYIEKQNRFRTIKIPTLGVQTTQFDISSKQRQALYDSGLHAGKQFFEQWNYAHYLHQFSELV